MKHIIPKHILDQIVEIEVRFLDFDKVINIFKKYGFKWGGVWRNPDYQHFYITL